MTEVTKSSETVRHYYVDEAGDGALFDARGRDIIGTQGCSHFFMLGVLDVEDPQALADGLDQLRTHLLAQPNPC